MPSVEFGTKLDRRIDDLKRNPNASENIVGAVVYVKDTLDLALGVATQVFGDKTTPDIVLTIYDRIDRERQRLTQGE